MGIRGTAVITGAAGGLGSAFAQHLAQDGFDLILIDNAKDRLAALASQLRVAGVLVQEIAVDLSNAKEVQELAKTLTTIGTLRILVNNAGFGLVCKFQSIDLERVIAMVQVHIVATLALCRAVLPGMIARGEGNIINVASAAAFMRFPRDAAYIPSKAYLVAFTECLALDLVGTGVGAQVLCPGWMTTDFSVGPELEKVGYKSPIPRWLFVSPERVVASSLRAMATGAVTHFPDVRARVLTSCIGSKPGQWLLALMRRSGMGQAPMPGD